MGQANEWWKKVLIISPHSDDETLSLGGTICNIKAKGEIKTVDQLSNILNEMFAKYGDDLKYGFMVFEFGGKTHYWIKMNNKLKKKMQGLADECRETGGSLSERMYAVFECEYDKIKKEV